MNSLTLIMIGIIIGLILRQSLDLARTLVERVRGIEVKVEMDGQSGERSLKENLGLTTKRRSGGPDA
jgi:ABC-type bacteriocin/lantibiotic exporter with double-glycine peptidase domain